MMLAGFEYFDPKKFPMATPTKLKIKVVTPIINIAVQILTCRKANVTPIAKASMLVAIANKNIVLISFFEEFLSSSSPKASRIILAPIKNNNPNAIQWSILVIKLSN